MASSRNNMPDMSSGPYHAVSAAAGWQPQIIHVTDDGDTTSEWSAPRHIWNVPKKPNKDKEKRNPVEKYYYEVWMSGFARWISGLVVLGLSAFIISNAPVTPLFEVVVASLACAGLHIVLFGPYVRSRSPTDARPPGWYLIVLAASSVAWAAIFASMVAVVSIDPYTLSAFGKRGKGAIADNTFGAAGSLADYRIISLTAFTGLAFVCCLLQWFYVAMLHGSEFEEEDIREVYVKASKQTKEGESGGFV